MSNKNGRRLPKRMVVASLPAGLAPPSSLANSPFSWATQARLDRAGLRVQQAQQQLQALEGQVQAARNSYNEQFGRLKGVLEAALEEEGFDPDTEASFHDGHVFLIDAKRLNQVEVAMIPEEPPVKAK